MNTFIKAVTKSDQKVALLSIKSLLKNEEKVLDKNKKAIKLKIQGLDDEISIPIQAFVLLKTILNNMAKGKSIALLLSDSEISTQQAADILSVSRPHVVKLLEKGMIPYKKVGTHRRINLKDILEYESKVKKARREELDFLTKEAQELNLGYE
ncbi:MAG: excisionase family DNA-binding protein [Bacteroidota bacterium]